MNLPINSLFKYASCTNITNAKAVIFGAHTKTAGNSESYLGSKKINNEIFCGDFVRIADNESPSLPENLMSGQSLFDMGNIEVCYISQQKEIESVKQTYLNIFKRGKVPICLGGDHIIKYAALEAINELFNDCWIAYIDAHPDCNMIDSLNYSSILHWGFKLKNIKPINLALIGLRQLNQSEANSYIHYQPYTIWSSDFVSSTLKNIYKKLKNSFSGYENVYLSVDLDGLDPSFAPSVEAPYPGGPSLREVIYLIKEIAKDFKIIGLDISEFLPSVDHLKITALTTARLVKEVYSKL